MNFWKNFWVKSLRTGGFKNVRTGGEVTSAGGSVPHYLPYSPPLLVNNYKQSEISSKPF